MLNSQKTYQDRASVVKSDEILNDSAFEDKCVQTDNLIQPTADKTLISGSENIPLELNL